MTHEEEREAIWARWRQQFQHVSTEETEASWARAATERDFQGKRIGELEAQRDAATTEKERRECEYLLKMAREAHERARESAAYYQAAFDFEAGELVRFYGSIFKTQPTKGKGKRARPR